MTKCSYRHPLAPFRAVSFRSGNSHSVFFTYFYVHYEQESTLSHKTIKKSFKITVVRNNYPTVHETEPLNQG